MEVVQAHRCRLCSSPHRQVVEDWRFKNGLAYSQIIERAQREFGLPLSLNMLSRHLTYVGSEMGQIVEDQMREVVRDHSTVAANVPVENIALASQLIARLVKVGEDGTITGVANNELLTDMMRERRTSAALILSHSPSSPESKLAALADVAQRVLGRVEE